MQIFDNDKDYTLFENTLAEAKDKVDMKILSYCVMPNHFHFVLQPRNDGDLSRFMNWFTMTHTQRWHVQKKTVGSGHLYQGRYKSFIINTDAYFYELVRYVEQNPLRAGMVEKAEDWKWGSLWRRQFGSTKEHGLLSEWPMEVPEDYMERVNSLVTKEVQEKIKNSVKRDTPLGEDASVNKLVQRFGLQSTLRARGRPKKGS